MTKKRKSGYDYLKERVAELEEELFKAIDEGDEDCQLAYAENERLREELKRTKENLQKHIEHYHWLYGHAPFWLKWWYCKHFFGK